MGEITTRNYSRILAKQFLELLKGNTHRIYVVIGNTTAGQSASTPTFTGFSDMKTFWDNAAGFKRVTSADASLVVPHGTGTAIAEWDASQGFAMYKHTTNLFNSPTNPFVAYRDSGSYIDIYKCLFNSPGSTMATGPTVPANSSDMIRNTASDGFFWKYMYSFADTSTFFTTDTNFKWLPVQTLTTKPSDAINLRQWNIQTDAVDGAIDVITHATDFGSAYTIGSSVTVNNVVGGSGFTGKIGQVGSTTKRYLDVTSSGMSAGSGYRAATVNSHSDLTAIMSPIGGHGFDAESELGAKDVMVTARITDSDIDADSSVPRFAQVGLISDPIISGSSFDDILATSTSISSGTRASNNSYLTAGLLKYSGKILYVDNRATITRNNSNTDTIRIVLQF